MDVFIYNKCKRNSIRSYIRTEILFIFSILLIYEYYISNGYYKKEKNTYKKEYTMNTFTIHYFYINNTSKHYNL